MPRVKIEIGNFYRDGLGRKIGPMYPLPLLLRYQRLVWGAENYTPADEPHEWTDAGRCQLNTYRPKGDYDLHAEWTAADDQRLQDEENARLRKL